MENAYRITFLLKAALVGLLHLVLSVSCFKLHAGKLTTQLGSSFALQDVKEDYAANVMNTYGRYPLVISHGKGAYLFDADGKEYLDCAAGIATCCLGYSDPGLKAAISEQMDRVHHCSNLYFIPEQGKLAKWLVDGSCADKVFFCNSGAEANEAAIKLARKYAHTKLDIPEDGVPVIITARSSFHGRTLATITATGQPKYQKNFGPLMSGFEYVDYNNPEQLRTLVERIQSAGVGVDGKRKSGLAAIMLEALQGEGGIRPATKEFLQTARELCDATGALLIIDEVQTGMGRTGALWAHQQEALGGLQPDVFTSAKAIGGGVPLGAMLAKEHCNVFGPGDHASTYGGNPLACAAGLAVAAAMDSQDLVGNAKARGEQFRAAVKHMIETDGDGTLGGVLQEVRGWGLINGVALHDPQSKPDGVTLTAGEVTGRLMQSGLLVVPAGTHVVRFVPPLIVTQQQVERMVSQLQTTLAELVAEKTASLAQNKDKVAAAPAP